DRQAATDVIDWLGRNSHLWVYANEAAAQTYATRSLLRGLTFPVAEGYVSTERAVMEAGGIGIPAPAGRRGEAALRGAPEAGPGGDRASSGDPPGVLAWQQR